MAMLAESLHTLSDIFVTGFLFVALVYSRKRADEDHMFGIGRVHDEADAGYCVIRIEAAAPSAAVHQRAEESSVPVSA